MADDIVDLRSVNWTEGMFLTPEHFLRQERYGDSLLLWLLRYSAGGTGLVGGGPRVDPAERGAPRYDPVVEFDESEHALTLSVTQCRGITPGGAVVDVDPSRALSATIAKKELEGALEVGVYVVARPHLKEPDSVTDDPANPGRQTARRPAYALKLDVQADEREWSLLLARLRRAERGLRFERAAGFIPPCAFMSSHSQLMHAYRQLSERVATIADRYGKLHRAIVDFIAIARPKLDVEADRETLEFISRMVMTLEACAYEILDPLQSPRRFFQQMTRLVRSAALFLSLSPPTREYFRQLGEIGEVEFVSMLEQETQALEMDRRWSVHDDLNPEAQKVMRALDRLDRLEQALEGKYLDFRLSPSLESLNFVFDRTSGEPILYRTVATPARPMAHGQELTFVFSPLRLEAREQYRLILVGERTARFVAGDRLPVELRINPGSGYTHRPINGVARQEIDEQRNFAVDFRAPDDVASITDVRVSVQASQPIRSAILYSRARLTPGRQAMTPSPDFGREPSRPAGINQMGQITPPIGHGVGRLHPADDAAADQQGGRRKPRLSGGS